MREEIIKKTITELVYVANDGTAFKNKKYFGVNYETFKKEKL